MTGYQRKPRKFYDRISYWQKNSRSQQKQRSPAVKSIVLIKNYELLAQKSQSQIETDKLLPIKLQYQKWKATGAKNEGQVPEVLENPEVLEGYES